MKLKLIQITRIVVLALILTLGVGYALSASVFTNPACPPPGCNTDAPINVGGSIEDPSTAQIKTGVLTLMHLLTPDLIVLKNPGTTSVIEGQVLTAKDAFGRVEWRTPAVSDFMKEFKESRGIPEWPNAIACKYTVNSRVAAVVFQLYGHYQNYGDWGNVVAYGIPGGSIGGSGVVVMYSKLNARRVGFSYNGGSEYVFNCPDQLSKDGRSVQIYTNIPIF